MVKQPSSKRVAKVPVVMQMEALECGGGWAEKLLKLMHELYPEKKTPALSGNFPIAFDY